MTQFTHQYFRSHPDSHQWSDVLEALGTYKNFKVLHSVKNPLLELQPISTLADSIGKERYALYLRLGEGNRYKLMLWADQDIEQSKNVTPHIQAVIDKLEKYIQQNPQIQNPALDSGVPIDYLSSQKVRKQFKGTSE